jgi:hypothetical protein
MAKKTPSKNLVARDKDYQSLLTEAEIPNVQRISES